MRSRSVFRQSRIISHRDARKIGRGADDHVDALEQILVGRRKERLRTRPSTRGGRSQSEAH
eukprot:5825255-Pleurochrysis_carterae.AAC.1